MQHDVAGNFKVIALMIAGTVYEQQDELAGILLGQCLQENLEALRVGRRHDQIDTGAILRADGNVPQEIAGRELPLGPYPTQSQFSATLFENDIADAFVLSILGETATTLVRQNQKGFLFYPAYVEQWSPADRDWLRRDFSRIELLDVETSMRNLRGIIERIRRRSESPILVYNVSSVVPGETIHCLQGLGEIYSTRCRRFNLGLAELSEDLGVSIVDVDSILARAGADKLKIDAMHLTADGYRLVAEEVVRILVDLGVISTLQESKCVPV